MTTTLVDRRAELVERDQEQVVGERPRRLDALERVVDRRRLGAADVDRQQPMTAVLLAQQHHRRVGRDLDPDTDQFQRDHGSIVLLVRRGDRGASTVGRGR